MTNDLSFLIRAIVGSEPHGVCDKWRVWRRGHGGGGINVVNGGTEAVEVDRRAGGSRHDLSLPRYYSENGREGVDDLASGVMNQCGQSAFTGTGS